ncbi:MAG: sterol desaturase family protein [Deltaproteobacteria bacterium]
MTRAIRETIAYTLWPLLLGIPVYIIFLGLEKGRPTFYFNAAYLGLAGTLFLLERIMPYRADWVRSDGQEFPDLAHTLLNKGLIQFALFLLLISGIMETMGDKPAQSIWPSGLPTALQVLIALVVSEFGLYWAHRLAHTWNFLWRFHSVHHSVEKLWFFNTGRFHFVDTFCSLLFSIPLLFILGVPGDIFIYFSSITAFIGLLTHCNVHLHGGLLNYVFNTPNLHRWHHSRKIEEGNNNYGENLMIFDMLFGTYYYPRDRHVGTIGIKEYMPRAFLNQLVAPFLWNKYQKKP